MLLIYSSGSLIALNQFTGEMVSQIKLDPVKHVRAPNPEAGADPPAASPSIDIIPQNPAEPLGMRFVSIDQQEYLLTADRASTSVRIYSTIWDGCATRFQFLSELKPDLPEDSDCFLVSVCYLPTTGEVVVCDRPGNRLIFFRSLLDTTVTRQLLDNFNEPEGLLATGDSIFVADKGNARVAEYDVADLRLRRTFSDARDFHPIDLAVTADGVLVVVGEGRLNLISLATGDAVPIPDAWEPLFGRHTNEYVSRCKYLSSTSLSPSLLHNMLTNLSLSLSLSLIFTIFLLCDYLKSLLIFD
jgi:hypothetical protein